MLSNKNGYVIHTKFKSFIYSIRWFWTSASPLGLTNPNNMLTNPNNKLTVLIRYYLITAGGFLILLSINFFVFLF